ncbi:MAG: OmpH family outer membrane protein [Calditrichia bacterium]
MKKGVYILTSVLAFLLLISSTAQAQMKIRYINTQRVLVEYPEAQELQKQLDDLKKTYEAEFQAKQVNAQKLVEEIQKQSLLLSPEKKAEKEAQLAQTQQELETYYYAKLGPQGEYFQKNQQLQEPLMNKINETIKLVGEEEGCDYILDLVAGSVLYSKPEHDLTDKVLAALGKAK